MKNKEFTTAQSINMVKDMLKDKTLKRSKDKLEVGDLFFGVYDAKNKEEVYNKVRLMINRMNIGLTVDISDTNGNSIISDEGLLNNGEGKC